MSALAEVQHHILPVGQGLFCLGRLIFHEPSREQKLVWVYDCGSNNQPELQVQIEEVRRRQLVNREIDVLILSHFDEDHINGLKELLAGVKVKWVILPYLTPADRLILAASEEDMGPASAAFAFDPAQYLRSLAESIEQVVYVESDIDTDQEIPGAEAPPGDFVDDLPLRIVPDLRQTSRTRDDTNDERDESETGSDARRALPGSRLVYGALWEFVFTNRPAWRGDMKLLKKQVAELYRAETEKAEAKRDYDALVRNVRDVFRQEKQFGKGEIGRNDISLMTYTGPVGREGIDLFGRWRRVCVYPVGHTLWPHYGWSRDMTNLRWAEAGAILYTGDITMSTVRRAQLQRRLGSVRWRRVELLQVPHHGANGAWKEKDMLQWAHVWSAFSSGMYNSHGHPGRSTVMKLASNHPVFVNEFQGFYWSSFLEWR